MKMTKKWLAAVGAAVMAVSVLLAPGANVAKASSASALVVDAKIGDVSAKVGDEISIPITVSSESALRGFNGTVIMIHPYWSIRELNAACPEWTAAQVEILAIWLAPPVHSRVQKSA